MKKRKIGFSLIELIIGFALLSLLLTSLFACLKNQLFFSRKGQVLEHTVSKEVMLHSYLSQMFLDLKNDDTETTLSTYEKDNTNFLHCCFNNGVQKNPDFAGHVDAKIYVDRKEKKLVCSIEHTGEEKPRVKELFSNVQSLSYSFIDPKSFKEEPTWPKESKTLPLAVKLALKIENSKDPLCFYFILVQTPPIYHYEAKT
ncbi:hypothetical protein COB21_03870 [Candidatus Aerophobetes bacterium]|uniref:Prepilin-type N-terminal cleavage/methylation domain-containing protein n=1 Tax=Aerophobetes bacterium TaxID=2030807 RepID=A0A2A4X3A3_UNCAE|nr:MAG: hypothetical protein COB21_03870 [Candidatus Aerophobetes bacterium]